jgi:hypothetical protein
MANARPRKWKKRNVSRIDIGLSFGDTRNVYGVAAPNVSGSKKKHRCDNPMSAAKRYRLAENIL